MADDDDTNAPTFTQNDVSAAATKAAKEAERKAKQAASQAIADQLGMTVEEAAAVIAAKRAEDDANASELDRARNAAAEAEAKATQAEARANAIEATNRATTALLAAQVDPRYIGDAVRLIDVNAEDLNVEAMALAERIPALFTAGDTGTPPPPPVGIKPVGQPATRGGGLSREEKAKAIFESLTPTRKPAA